MFYGDAALKNSILSKPTSIHAYAAFDKYIDKVQQRLMPRLHPVLGCDTGTVCDRLMQRLVELTLGPYVTQLAKHVRDNKPFLHAESATINLDGIYIDTRSGAVDLTPQFFLNACLEFAVHWLHALYTILCIGSTTFRGKATLVFGVGAESLFYEGNDHRFVEFCRKGPITPLAYATRLIIQSLTYTGSCSDNRVSYSRHPFAQLAREIQLGRLQRALLLARHLMMPLRYLLNIIRFPILALLSRDFAVAPLMASLNQSGMIESVIFTNSNYSSQPIWARLSRLYKTHMIWYSQNVIPLAMKDDEFTKDFPIYRYMKIDMHWVWTSGFKLYLERSAAQAATINVVGPIMWYLPPIDLNKKKAIPNIVIFDVVPVDTTFSESIGILANYYSPQNMKLFLNLILKVTINLKKETDINFNLLLKHKRNHSNIHDKGYIELVDSAVKNGDISLIPSNTNIYEVLSGDSLSIIVPYSSPAYIANSIGKSAIYFDPTQRLIENFEKGKWISFASSSAALGKIIRAWLLNTRT